MRTTGVRILALLLVLCVLGQARYLPTRAGRMDRLDKLRELLRELLESEIEHEEHDADAAPRWHPDTRLFYKRDAPQDNAEFAASRI